MRTIIIRPGIFPMRAAHPLLPDRIFRGCSAAAVVAPIEIEMRLDQGQGFEPIAAEAAAPSTTSATAASVTDATPTPLPSSGPPSVIVPLPRSSKVQADAVGEASKPRKAQSARPPRSRKAVAAEPTDSCRCRNRVRSGPTSRTPC